MMKSIRWLTTVAGIAATLMLLGSVASAAPFTDQTSIKLHASETRVDPGTKVKFTGKLKADHAFCRNDQKVVLRTYGESNGQSYPGGVVDKTKTDQGGHYTFKVVINEQIRFRVWYGGRVGGTHPDIKVCEKSRSKTVTIDVT